MKTLTTTYQTKEIKIKNTIFSVLIAMNENGLKYVSIRKETNNPFKSMGKEFANFDEAVKNYKSPQMKIELLLIESNL
jgi:hypothetical protein